MATQSAVAFGVRNSASISQRICTILQTTARDYGLALHHLSGQEASASPAMLFRHPNGQGSGEGTCVPLVSCRLSLTIGQE
jgi:hypothetical protein